MGKWFYFRNITRAYSEIWSLNIKGKGKEKQDPDFLSSGGGRALRACCWRRRWALRTCTCDDLSTTTYPLQHRSSELDRQGPGDTECVWVLAQFLQAGPDLAIPPSILSSWLTVWQKGKGAPFERARPFWEGAPLLEGHTPLERARSFERACPFGEGAPLLEGHVHFDLIGGKGAPLLEGRVHSVTLKT